MPNSATVRIRDLVVEYRTGAYPVRPIDNFSLDVAPGSLVLLLGPSGCGKTTLLSCLGGILSPTEGSIQIGDTDVHSLRGSALEQYRQHSVGIVFQAFNLVPSLDAMENVMLPMRSAGVKKAEARMRAEELLKSVDLGERLGHRPSDMSGGQQQRVAIARAMALDPQLILADEPTAHLDYVQVEGVLRLIRSLADRGRTVIVSTHDERMVPLADQVVEMRPSHGNDATASLRSYDAGWTIFHQGQPGNEIFVIERGEVDILREFSNGSFESLAVRRSGEFFGEMGPLFGMPRSATARARGPVTVSVHTATSFRALIGRDHLPQAIAGASTRVLTSSD